jgi:hypothetical protein
LVTIIALWLLLSIPVSAADSTEVVPAEDTVFVNAPPEAEGEPDTSLYYPPADPTAAGNVTNPVDLEKHLRQNPTVALFKSMFVPGLGQLGNGRYVKAIVIAGLEGWLISRAVYWGRKASDARDDFDNAIDVVDRNRLYSIYDEKRKNRNKFTWFAGITIFVSMFDAYVDAHLSGSPTDKRNEQFSFDVIPDDQGGVSASLAYSF